MSGLAGEMPRLGAIVIRRSFLSFLVGWLDEAAVISVKAKFPSVAFSLNGCCETAFTLLSPGFCYVKSDLLVDVLRAMFYVDAITSTISSFSLIAFLMI